MKVEITVLKDAGSPSVTTKPLCMWVDSTHQSKVDLREVSECQMGNLLNIFVHLLICEIRTLYTFLGHL
jgi:hypothetical protein